MLEGAPALVAAVDRRARVRLAPAAEWSLATLPDLDGAGMARSAVFDAVRRTLAAHCELPPRAVTVDTRAFFGPEGKLGLGASAAVAAALTTALAAAGGLRAGPNELCALAIAAHREAQGGSGSGADVAAAIHGGVVDFAAGRDPYPLSWPRDLHAEAVVTGGGADTRDLVGTVRRLRETEPARYERHMGRLGRLAEAGRDAFAAGDAAAFVTAADDYREALAALGDAAGAAILLPAHARLAALAAEAGAVFKPSGAGGGDLGLVLADSPGKLERACAAIRSAGFAVPALRFGAAGAGPAD
ncbi:kinase ATP-binding domain, GHMP family protein [Salinisphaera sp. PC39]|uniref:GHMP family kinase ATP-binding protein n=1 Tax=Salinisphaera sp. PC39 TaxID=1304156 RepID=UPI00333ECE1F